MTDGPIEYRTAGALVSVDYEGRIIDCIAVPYDQWAPVELAGRMVEESFAPGAFAGVEKRTRRLQVNINHDSSQFVGRVLKLRPRDPAGLRAELLIRKTPEGIMALQDAADGMYSASIAFAVKPEWVDWQGRTRRRITQAYLEHIALTPEPAYEGAEVLAVRHATSSQTPNLDRVLAERQQLAYPPP